MLGVSSHGFGHAEGWVALFLFFFALARFNRTGQSRDRFINQRSLCRGQKQTSMSGSRRTVSTTVPR